MEGPEGHPGGKQLCKTVHPVRYCRRVKNKANCVIYVGSLDKSRRIIKIGRISVSFLMQSPCDHKRTQVIARRDGVDYVECLDCRQIFEAEDLEPVTVEDEEE